MGVPDEWPSRVRVCARVQTEPGLQANWHVYDQVQQDRTGHPKAGFLLQPQSDTADM
jgi:hypothetical protein